MNDKCQQCNGYSLCIDAAFNNTVVRCIHFSQLKMNFDKFIDKFNEIGFPNTLSAKEIEYLIHKKQIGCNNLNAGICNKIRVLFVFRRRRRYMNEKIENGKLDVMGINIDISQVLGQKIVDQYIAQLKEEDMETIIKYISNDLFTETSVFNYATGENVTKLTIKERKKDQWGRYTDAEIPIGEFIKKKFNERIKEELGKKVEEIIATSDYQKKIDDIANELIDYSVNGYKEDMKNRIKERLVGNILNTEPYYDGLSLQYIINKAIDRRLQD